MQNNTTGYLQYKTTDSLKNKTADSLQNNTTESLQNKTTGSLQNIKTILYKIKQAIFTEGLNSWLVHETCEKKKNFITYYKYLL